MADRRLSQWPFVLEPMPPGMTCKPCYKAKLPSKCLTNHKSKFLKLSTSLDSRRWVFVKEGLDDFRKGCPPCDGMVTRGPKEAFLPVISHRVPRPAPAKRKLPSKAGLFPMLSQAQLARKAFVEDMEAQLTKHPLATYPNLEEDLPADLLLKVLEELDPERKLEDTWAYCKGNREKSKMPTKVSKRRTAKAFLEPLKASASHPDKLCQRSSIHELHEGTVRSAVPRIVCDFCKWAAASGYQDIDEDYVIQQFTISHKWKPGFESYCMVNVHDVHPELKHITELHERDEMKSSMDELGWETELQETPEIWKTTRVKMKYGAWYLKTKLWKKLMSNEPLIDPKIILEAERERMKPDIIDDLYGTIAFKDFILSRGYNMPHILEKLFTRKGWDYESVKTPISKVTRIHLKLGEHTEEDDMTILQ
ncbi:protein FAM47E [Oryctolagus cuniculus]|nr:protein FAM47E [Oryctolagus cuniculus]